MTVARRSALGRHRPALAALLTVAMLGAAVTAAFLTRPDAHPVTGGVESASFGLAVLLGGVASALPLGYAFGAGIVAAVNPCGFVLLPAYLALYLGQTNSAGSGVPVARRLVQSLRVSALITAGFVVLFGLAGLGVSVAASAIGASFPWVGLAVGLLLVFAGGRLLGGGVFYAGFGARLADRLGQGAGGSSNRGYLIYGLAYGLASLSCTMPIFLTVVGSALTVDGYLAASLQFVLYALGMGFTLSVLTVSTAFFRSALFARGRSILPYFQPLSSVLLLLAGTYIVYYWLTLGGLLTSFR